MQTVVGAAGREEKGKASWPGAESRELRRRGKGGEGQRRMCANDEPGIIGGLIRKGDKQEW
eukprot:104704-Chlamydomonas_euryale.AAC.1